jgi:predicted nucleic acid-binding protein
MKYSLDTNVILSHFKEDRFSDDTDSFFAWIKNEGHEMYISDLVYVELYIGIYLSKDSANEKKQLQRFLAVNNIEGKYTSSKIINDLVSFLQRTCCEISSLKRKLPNLIVGAHAEQYSDALVTWNPSVYDINKAVMTPLEAMDEHDKA